MNMRNSIRRLCGLCFESLPSTSATAAKSSKLCLQNFASDASNSLSRAASLAYQGRNWWPSLSRQSFNTTRWNGGGGGYWGSPEHVLYGLIGTNAAVFAIWQMESNWRFMLDHFTSGLRNLEEGRIHTLVTSAFSHKDFTHLAVNMMALFFFGRTLSRVLGGQKMMKLYLTGGLVGSVADTAIKYKESAGRHPWARYDPPTLGASGAVKTITTLFILMFPKDIIYLNFLIPVPAFLVGLGFLLHDFAGFMNSQGNISHAAHLGGIAVGLAYFLRMRFVRF
ncbi:hypothetical protein BSKO_11312 [Bryopsis sp. KO-2023]|nr:hypothetical protein BSKO_11312 [Bryopsis sp. KO-2023]